LTLGLVTASSSLGSRAAPMARIAWACGNPPQICVMNADGSNARRLTSMKHGADSPSFSPDGKQIVFAAANGKELDLYVIGVNGTGLRRLTRTPWDEDGPVWSPDGALIAFVGDATGNADIYTMPARGGNETDITRSPWSDTDPAWSPNGKGLAFASNRGGSTQLWVMSRNGSQTSRLTPFQAITPAFSPDGREIVATGAGGLYLLDLAAGKAGRLTKGKVDTEPSWSHDGRLIVFRRGTGSSAELYVIRPDGTGLRRVTHNRVPDTLPAWSGGSTP
jgi:TolB protein